MKKKPFYKVLYVQVIFAIIVGVILGHFYPSIATDMKPLGDGFIKLIKMVIGPIIFCTVVTGIAGMEDMKKVGRVGGKALLYFEIVSTFALVLGLAATHPASGRRLQHRSGDARRQGRRVVRGEGARAVDGRLPDAHHPEHDGRCVRAGRDPADPADRTAVRQRARASRRARQGRHRLHRRARVLFGIVHIVRSWRRSARSARWRSRSASTASARWCRCSS